MNATVRVHGIREVNAAFRQIDKKLAKDFGDDLKKAAAPVVEETKALEGKWRGASIGTIRAKRSGPRAFVEQSARKVTGLKGQFGSLQMKEALVPALDSNANKVFTEVEKVLNRYRDSAGF